MNTVKLDILLFLHTSGFHLYIVRKVCIFGRNHSNFANECKKNIGYKTLCSILIKQYDIHHSFLGSSCAQVWGWTCIFVGSFVFILSFSVRRSLTLSLRHLSRLAVASGLWLGFRKLLCLLENAIGSCYEPLSSTLDLEACVRSGMLWRGYEVSEDALPLCLCCLLLAEETAVFGPYLSLGGPSIAPLRILFLFCVLLLGLWVFLLLCLLDYFPQFPTQLLGGALGCLSWRVLYQGWYRLGPSWYCPGRPGWPHKRQKRGVYKRCLFGHEPWKSLIRQE
uniref:Fat storage-inducing transmembrane protein 1 n=1 Tax=Cyprinus carpio TaxID=7962 RepID=A0A8C1Y7P8_CYPCA